MKGRAIVVRPVPDAIHTKGGRRAPAFSVVFGGRFPNAHFPAGKITLTLTVLDFDPDGNEHETSGPETIATVTGTLRRLSTDRADVRFDHFVLDDIASDEQQSWSDAEGRLDADDADANFPVAGFAFSDDTSAGSIAWFKLPKARKVFHCSADSGLVPSYFEGDTWELRLHVDTPDAGPLDSPTFTVGWNPRVVASHFVKRPAASYDWHAGNDVGFYVDANLDLAGKTGYFHDLRNAIQMARKLIFVVDWSFHPSTRLLPGDMSLELSVGGRLLAKASQGVTVAVLTWPHPTLLPDPVNDDASAIIGQMAEKLGFPHRVLWQASKRKLGYAHHQKFVVVDDGQARGRLKVFFGGIDFTQGRSDWPDHPILWEDAACKNFQKPLAWSGKHGPYDDWYNAEFQSSDYGLPHPDDKAQPVVEVGKGIVEGLFVRVVKHGFQPGDVVFIDAVPPLGGDRVVVNVDGYPSEDWFGIRELDGGTISTESPYPYPGQPTVRKMLRYPREPWHDVHARLEGPIAWDFAREFVGRWTKSGAGGAAVSQVWDTFYDLFDRSRFVQQWEDHLHTTSEAPPPEPPPPAATSAPQPAPAEGAFAAMVGAVESVPVMRQAASLIDQAQKKLHDAEESILGTPPPEPPPPPAAAPLASPIFSGQLLHSFDRTHLGNPRTNDRWHPNHKEMVWRLSGSSERSVQDAYLKAILQAERFIYIETQYFIGSGAQYDRGSVKNRLPEALVNKIVSMIGKKFHVYIILPQYPEGSPVYGNTNPVPGVRNLEWRTIAYMIDSVKQACPNWQDYLSFYFLERCDLTAAHGPYLPNAQIDNEAIRRTANVICNRRYMVYVHTKLMIVDDRFVILGSANLNERSLAGDRDTEICVSLWPASNRTESQCESTIQSLRSSLLTEHLGGAPPGSFVNPNQDAFRSLFQKQARDNFNGLLQSGAAGPRMKGHIVMFPFDVDSDREWKRPDWACDDPLVPYIIDSLKTGDPDIDARSTSDFWGGYWRWPSAMPAVGGLARDLLE